ncbi:MAG TPA: Flp pilus assembly protein CpaB [Candidatus Polarisedimenticolia bacterium]|nr:Flp pilus assembly protein CpaB [Candidatus Polarisedimenticolia bacterium]
MATSAPVGRGRRSRLYIIIGTVLAVVAFVAAASLASAPFLFPASPLGTKVVVAKTNIPARTRITTEDLTLSAISPIPPESFTNIAAVVGKGARVDIPSGEPVTANIIAAAPDLVSSSDVTYLPIPQGYVAVAIPTSEQAGVAGYVVVGDRISILASLNTQVLGASPAVLAVRTVFRDLMILRVGPPTTGQATSQVSTSLTVLMTACDSEYMFWLINNATLKYELESFHDYGATPTQPDPGCASVLAAKGVGPTAVNKRWSFTTP